MSLPKILVVDDCNSVRIKVKRILANAGYEVITACDGLDAIEKLDEQTSLIVLDVNMPGLDGYGVCEQIRELGSTYNNLPIVFLTCLESKALELLGREFGAYLNKPVCEQKLLSVVEQQLAQSTF
jgi:CheY-like chemotaxis protein